jgi:hypothetical protein
VDYDITFVNLLEAGLSRSSAVQGNYLYAGLGNYLLVVDVSDPTHPTRVASARVITRSSMLNVTGIAVAGQYVLTASDDGLEIFDVSDPLHPLSVGKDDTDDATGVAVSGSLAYVSGVHGLRVVDISDPANPTVIGSATTTGSGQQLEVVGQYAYVADFNGELMVIDVGDPAAPAQLTHLDVGAYSWGLDVQGNLAYLPVQYGASGMSIIDVSNPSAPVQIGRYYSPDVYGTDVVVDGPYAYLSDNQYYFEVIDVSNPTSPFRVAQIDDRGAYDICKQGNYLYLADSQSSFRVMDVTDPTEPAVVGAYQTIVGATSMEWNAPLAYVGEEGGFLVVDFSDPADPRIIDEIGCCGIAADIELLGANLFTANDTWIWDDDMGGFSIFDRRSPTHPVRIATRFSFDNVYDIEVDASHLYGIGDRNGYKFFICDISDHAHPVELAARSLGGFARRLDVAANVAYVADGSGGLLLFDITDRSNPLLLSTFGLGGHISDVQVIGNIAYVADSYSGLVLVDVSNASEPVEISRTTGIGQPSYITVKFPFVVATGTPDTRLRIIDVSHPLSPAVVASYEAGDFGPVAVNGPILSVVCRSNGSVLLLRAEFLDTSSGIEDMTRQPLRLTGHYPNPFSGTTTIEFATSRSQPVEVAVFNVAGRRVATLVNGRMPDGASRVTWDGRDDDNRPVSSGVYFCRLRAGTEETVAKLILLR